MYFWINFFLWSLGILWFGLFFSLALEPRWKKLPAWALAVGFCVLAMPMAYFKITHPTVEALYWIAVLTTLMYVFVAFTDKLWKKILLFFLFVAATEVSELPLTSLMNYLKLSFDISFDSPHMTLFVAAATVISVTLTALLLIVWRRLMTRRIILRRIYIFFIFPISQLLMLLSFDGFFPETTFLNGIFANTGALLGLLADFILLYVLMEQGQKELLERKLQELETLHRVEEVHYQAIEARRHELAKIRHDFNNQLAAAYNLVRHGAGESAGELLDELKATIGETTEYTYCANAIVNAVLAEKAPECEKNSIRLTTDVELPEELQIQAVHLCSIFSNLCDNAVKAAKECDEGQRFVSVRATRRGDYLHVKVENSAPDPKTKKKSARREYGQEILADIASRYDGEMICGWKDGVYGAMVSLTVPVAPAKMEKAVSDMLSPDTF